MISPLIRWNHTDDVYVHRYDVGVATNAGEKSITIDINTTADNFLIGHTIDGRILYPATGYIVRTILRFPSKIEHCFFRIKMVMENFSEIPCVITNFKFILV